VPASCCYFADIGDSHTRAQFYRAHVRGQQVEVATRIDLNDYAQISEITVYVRPLPGLTALASALVPPIAGGRHGSFRALIGRLLVDPLAFATRLGDRLTTLAVPRRVSGIIALAMRIIDRRG
jgi:hypothetical protein